MDNQGCCWLTSTLKLLEAETQMVAPRFLLPFSAKGRTDIDEPNGAIVHPRAAKAACEYGGIKAAVGAYVSKLRPAKPGQMTRIRLKEAAGNRIHGEIAADERQEMLWQAFFLDPTLWWDNRQEKRSFYHPDFRHKRLKEALWLDNRYKPAWVDSRLVRGDTGLEPLVTQPLGCASTWTFGNEVAQISGELKEAIEALEVLVQRGSYVNNALFYRVLKRCMAQKDLAIGRQVHEVGSSQMSS